MDLESILSDALGHAVEGVAVEDLPEIRRLGQSLASSLAAYAAVLSRPNSDSISRDVARGDVVTATVLLHQAVERSAKRRGLAFAREIAGAAVAVLLAVLRR